jgi:DNA polymerase-3 subunit epsilon/ATP-dependent DNA helicase DinG
LARHYVALDLETTGLNPQTDAIIEVGAVRFTRDGILDTYQTLVNPRRHVPAAVWMLTGIGDEDVRAAPPIEAVAGTIEDFIGDSVLVGHNVIGFDAPLLDGAGIRYGADIYDTQELATLLVPGLSHYGLAALLEHFGVAFPLQHRAQADAEATRELFLRLLAAAARLRPETLAQAAQWLTPTAWPWRAFFREAG